MKTSQVICDANGQRKVTSTTETLRIKASEIEPGDWLLKPHGRVMRKDKLAIVVRQGEFGRMSFVDVTSGETIELHSSQMVDVERTR